MTREEFFAELEEILELPAGTVKGPEKLEDLEQWNSVAMIGWSLCAMATALGCGPVSFGIFRGLLGFCESPSFPAAAKVCAEWFPRRQRAFAFGFVNAGANMAAIVTPFIVSWLTLRYRWQAAFIWTGAMGLMLAAVWFLLFRRPEDLSARVHAAWNQSGVLSVSRSR